MKYLNKEEIMKRHSPILIYVVCVMISFVCACNKSGGLFKDPYSRKTDAIDLLPGSENPDFILDKEKLSQLVESIENRKFGNIHSLVIIHNDRLVLEEYFQGWNRNKLHKIYSASKSVTSALIGIAIDKGNIKGPQEKLLNFFPEYKSIAHLDERKKAITLEDVLTMSAGFKSHEFETPYFDKKGNQNPDNDAVKALQSSDCIKHTLDLPMIYTPGSEFAYNSGGSLLLSGIIQNTTGESAEEFARKNLFEPLGIKEWEWRTISNNISDTCAGLKLRPVDMALFGYLYLNNGKIFEQQIISKEWVEKSTAYYIDGFPNGYGYHWWRRTKLSLDEDSYAVQDNNIYFAFGAFGQSIFILPDYNMVVVMTGKNAVFPHESFDILEKYIVPALQKK
jgi:CubicO group peptidase (beta-lactamase class C family)